MIVSLAGSPAAAQTTTIEPVTFDEAIRRATTANPSVAIAAANILRAEALLQQARAATLPMISAEASNVTLDGAREVDGDVVTPQNTFSASIPVSMPLYAPAQWARRAQAADQRRVAQASADDIRRQVGVAAAQSYLTVIAAHRVVEAQQRSRDTAKAFFDYAHERFKAGASSRLNELRAQQTLSSDEALLEQAQLGLYRTQEALGVLLAADHPIDATNEPAFDIPPQADAATATQSVGLRTDIKLFATEVEAARRVVSDSSKDWYPTLNGIFEPAVSAAGLRVHARGQLARAAPALGAAVRFRGAQGTAPRAPGGLAAVGSDVERRRTRRSRPRSARPTKASAAASGCSRARAMRRHRPRRSSRSRTSASAPARRPTSK